jgi:hypothetical protein
MSVVDSFGETDPPGYRIDLVDDGTVHIIGNGMDQTLQAEGAGSAKQWYQQNAYAFLPLPPQVAAFVDAARTAGRALAHAASSATASLAEGSEVAAFASAVGEALTAVGAAIAPFGGGTDLLGMGVVITAEAGRAQQAAEGVLARVWDRLDDNIDFFALAEHAQQDRAVNDSARSQLHSFAAQAAQVGESTKALLNL